MDGLISLRDDVAVALEKRLPIVALESTVIAHGLPRPHNVETARKMEAVVREAGATPATIGILDGKMVVGLTDQQIAFLAEAQGVAKVSRSDVSAVLASGVPELLPSPQQCSSQREPTSMSLRRGYRRCTSRQRKHLRYLRGSNRTFANTRGGRLLRSEGHP